MILDGIGNHTNLHAASYWLNPRFQYIDQELEEHNHTTFGLLDVIERYSNENSDLRAKLTSEMKSFKMAQGDFGRRFVISDHNLMAPDISSFMISSFLFVYFCYVCLS